MAQQANNEKRLFEALVREHAGALSAYLHAVIDDKHEIDELFQEACIVAWKKLSDYDPQRPFGPWLRGIAKILVLRRNRKLANRKPEVSLEILAEMEATLRVIESGHGDTFDDNLDALEVCLSKLGGRYREAVDYRYFKGTDLKSASEQLLISVDGLKKRLHRAREMLRECLLRRGVLVEAPS